ncbi:uncharacterized protein OCT59_029138 [Rhizophagus irregularis]|uniref:uncharacterized protein n=1 Tax=Rhizophagus irregularis TaxID=588596 RepID=UPI00332F2A4C|nr:hypothetical protein OCT59_029138 [Rhizophagus irregularis]
MGIIDSTTERNTMDPNSKFHNRGLLPRKRKASAAFDDEFDYPYGIVTVLDWYFLIYTPERIYCSKADYHIDLTEDIVEDFDEMLRRNEYLISTCITSVDLLANPSELEVLRQRNSELEAKNVELEAKIVELEKWRQRAILNEEKIDELNAENAVLVDEIFELKSENAKLRWDHKSTVEDLKRKDTELENRLAKMEQEPRG